MLRRAVNEIEFTVEIDGKSPLLIKEGKKNIFVSRSGQQLVDEVDAASDPEDKRRLASGLNFYIPGSSVRGSWRSHLEKVLRSLDVQERVCDPFTEKGSLAEISCSQYAILLRADSKKRKERIGTQIESTDTPYRRSCPVCRLFGNTAQGGRISFTDGERKPLAGEKKLSGRVEVITNVAINRQTGSAKDKALFDFVALVGARFELRLQVRNFELWQLGLLGHLFDDLSGGFVPLGYGKNKGFGKISARVAKIRVTNFCNGTRNSDGHLTGLWDVCDDDQRKRYHLMPTDTPPSIAMTLEPAAALWRKSWTVDKPAEFWGKMKPYFNAKVWGEFQTLAQRVAVEHKNAGDPVHQS